MKRFYDIKSVALTLMHIALFVTVIATIITYGAWWQIPGKYIVICDAIVFFGLFTIMFFAYVIKELLRPIYYTKRIHEKMLDVYIHELAKSKRMKLRSLAPMKIKNENYYLLSWMERGI